MDDRLGLYEDYRTLIKYGIDEDMQSIDIYDWHKAVSSASIVKMSAAKSEVLSELIKKGE